jgi:MYXO-CTERM domain-containing protein
MRFWFRKATTSAVVGLLVGCSGLDTQQENLSVSQQAANICNETVPANRFVDGIPAYAQCSATTGAIYSNNGVDTATTSGGADWVRTQFSGGYQCTELAHRYLYFHWNVTWLPNGNAGTWCDATPPASSGVVQATTPVHGDLIVFAPGSCGADGTTGHVALVDVVNATNVTIVEQNSAGRRNTAITCAKCFLHVSANNGALGTGGASGTGGGTSVAGASSGGGGGSPQATGGLANTTGGAANTGGAPSPTGGASSTGGARPATGGKASTGGSNAQTGGAAATGGTLSTGGSTSIAPASATGGTTDDPTAGAPATGGTDATTSVPNDTSAVSTNPSSAGPDSQEGSCSCRVPHRDTRPPALLGLGLFALAAMRVRKRQRGA